jgi:DNA helicase II / ATP-dependent DNA helicase PcrA
MSVNTINLTEGMNEAQAHAVTYVDGPVLILAGAGSGKTRVITHRLAYLVYEMGISPGNILAVTFTNKAASEMKERVTSLLGGQARGLWVTTFHAMGSRILRRYANLLGFTEKLSIYSTSDQTALVKRLINESGLDVKRFPPKTVLNQISLWKQDLLSPSDLSAPQNDQRIVSIYATYQEELRKSNAMDFDDLLFYLVQLFRDHEEVLKEYQALFQYIMVDEFQDTNPIQYKIIRMLSQEHKNICVVGDEDQSIYSWRGADIRNILNFSEDYSTHDTPVKSFQLRVNYRCPRPCLEAANLLIENNTQRAKNKLKLVSHKGGEGSIPYVVVDNYIEEAKEVVRDMQRLNSEGVAFSKMTLLYRTHAQSRVFEQEFIRSGIPYQIFGNVRFFERLEIKEILAYLSLLHNPLDATALYRVLNVPPRGIGKTSLEKLRTFSSNHNVAPLLALDGIDTVQPRAQKSLKAFYAFYSELKQDLEAGATLVELTTRILQDTGYLKWRKKREEEDRLENVKELLSNIAEYENKEPQPSLEGFLEKAALITAIDDFEESAGSVAMMTLHNAKGLEFAYVFMVGLEEGLLPHKNSLDDPMRLEEERRLCYVGITRTMQELYLYASRIRMIFGEESYQVTSRFLREIGDKFLLKI